MDGKSFPLHDAARDGKALIVKGLVAENPKAVLEKDLDGRIPLHWAVSFSHLEIASILLNPNKFSSSDKKVQFDIDDYTDDAGWTALHIAASVGNVEMLELLLNHDPKPDVNLQTSTGVTAAHFATSKQHLDVLKLLKDNGASLTIKDKLGHQVIHRAAGNGNIGIVNYLISNKVPLNVKDSYSWTPMHRALAEGFGDVALALAKAGADTEATDDEGKTPYQVAESKEVAKFFKSECAALGIDV